MTREALSDRYFRLRREPSDINEHLPVLAELAIRSRRVTELGVRGGNSTTALLYGMPDELVCYDLNHCPIVDELLPLAGRTRFSFWVADSRRARIAPTDLLFIDTWHTYAQLSAELSLDAPQVRRWIALHDTTTFGEVGEDGGRGLWPAIEEFLGANSAWRLQTRLVNQNGFTILERGERGGISPLFFEMRDPDLESCRGAGPPMSVPRSPRYYHLPTGDPVPVAELLAIHQRLPRDFCRRDTMGRIRLCAGLAQAVQEFEDALVELPWAVAQMTRR